eukprot:3258129-Pyramimonas_sp.AAC.1
MGADRRRRHQHAGPNPQVPQVRVRKLGKHPGRGNTPGPRYEGVPDPGHPEVPVSAGDPGLISPIVMGSRYTSTESCASHNRVIPSS